MLLLSDDQQRRYFGESFSRASVADVYGPARVSLRLHARRNWAAEPTLNLVSRIAKEFQIHLAIECGPYDDSLQLPAGKAHDVQIIWPDWMRVSATSSRPEKVLEEVLLMAFTSDLPSLVVSPYRNDPLYDRFMTYAVSEPTSFGQCVVGAEEDIDLEWTRDTTQLAKFATDIPKSVLARTARSVFFAGVASVVYPPMKVLAVDFDNTLYKGVLGEDGLSGINVTPRHQDLIRQVDNLRKQGVLLVALSKNELVDIKKLLDSGRLHPLDADSFIDYRVSWNSKAKSLEMAADQLRIGIDAVGFMDDNPAEREIVRAECPGTYVIDAGDPDQVCEVIKRGPNVPRRLKDDLAFRRETDLRADAERSTWSKVVLDEVELHKRLETHLEVGLAQPRDLPRVAELLAKTNQFNLSLRRTPLASLKSLSGESDGFIAVACVRDRYADSGLVAAMTGQRRLEHLYLDEFVISCRVLGRHLESVLFLLMSRVGLGSRETADSIVHVPYSQGPRNKPALDWLATMGDMSRGGELSVVITLAGTTEPESMRTISIEGRACE